MSIRLKDTIYDLINNSNKLGGYNRSNLYESSSAWLDAVGLTKTITVTGESTKFYPVVITVSSDKKLPTYISVWKNLGTTTPSGLAGNHSNGTSSLWLRYEMRNTMWDGNGGYLKTWYKYQGYATLVAHARNNTKGHGGLIIWLRGGTCEYKITCTNTFSTNIYYSATNIGTTEHPDNLDILTSVNNGGIYTSTTLGYGNISGNAGTATKLQTARTISLTGSVTGSGSFDGSGNLSIATTTNHTHSYASKVTVGSTAYNVSSNNITIPAYPTTLKCPTSLTIKLNGTSQGAWDGSSAKTIDITPSSIGAAASSHTHSYAGSSSAGGPANSLSGFLTSNGRAHGSSSTSYTAVTHKSTYFSGVNGIDRGSWSYASNGYIATSDWGNIHLAGTLCLNAGTNDYFTSLFITPLTASVSNSILGEMVYYTYNKDYTSGWTRVLTNRNYASYCAKASHTHNYAGSSSAGGAATSANKLTTARTISLTGSVTGSGSFDGSGNLSIATTTNHTHSYAGSASAGGPATSANKINTNAGNATTPVYFSGGVPVACSVASGAATASTIAVRNSSGDIFARLIRQTYADQSTISGGIVFRVNNSSDNYLRVCNSPSAIRTFLGVPSSNDLGSYLPKRRMENPDPGHASIGAIPFILSLKAAGTALYGDPEFGSGNNSVNVYNYASNGAVTITRIADNQYSSNSSGYILKISTSATSASPGRGGFVQNMTSRAGAIFCQIFRAKIPTGYTLANAENSMGSSYKTHWLTSKAGTGKWEWYCRVTFCGTSGTFSSGGHVYLNADAGGTAAVTWYLSYCNVIDLTKGNYDGLRSSYAGTATQLASNAGSATNPIYFSGGKPVACTYSLNKTVPSNAVFTDTNTTYSAGSGLSLSGTTFNHASTVTAGTAGTSSATSGSTLAVPYVTVNATGHVTGYGTHTHTVTGFAASSHTHSYLPLSGGTISGTLQIKRSASAIQYLNASGTVWGWMGYDAENKATVWNSDGSTKYTILHSGNYTSYAPSLNHAYGYVMKMTTIDVSSLNVNTYYPVIIPVSPYNKTSVRIEVEVSLNSSTKPSWSTHNSGFSVRKVWETNGSGWGTATVSRRVIVSTYGFASSDPVRGIGQMTNSSNEYVYVRGGGKYFFFTSHGVTPSLKTSTYTVSSQSVAPTTTAPAAISESYSYVGHTHDYASSSHNHDSVYSKLGHTHSQYYDSGVSRTANTVLAAPNGSAGSATFRKLVAADIPALAISKITSLQTTLDGKAAKSHTHNYAGSSSAGGAATSANKLNTNAGTATKPVYFSGGVPVQVTAPMVQYWAIYEIFWGSGNASFSAVKKAGNYDFYKTCKTKEREGQAIITVNVPSGFTEDSMMVFGNGDHVGTNHISVGYLTIGKQVSNNSGAGTADIRVSISDDASLNFGYAYLYFLCIG